MKIAPYSKTAWKLSSHHRCIHLLGFTPNFIDDGSDCNLYFTNITTEFLFPQTRVRCSFWFEIHNYESLTLNLREEKKESWGHTL